MRDREKRMDHEIENGERIIYSRMVKGELRVEVGIELSIESRIEIENGIEN